VTRVPRRTGPVVRILRAIYHPGGILELRLSRSGVGRNTIRQTSAATANTPIVDRRWTADAATSSFADAGFCVAALSAGAR
jgi:hypothetical protein